MEMGSCWLLVSFEYQRVKTFVIVLIIVIIFVKNLKSFLLHAQVWKIKILSLALFFFKIFFQQKLKNVAVLEEMTGGLRGLFQLEKNLAGRPSNEIGAWTEWCISIFVVISFSLDFFWFVVFFMHWGHITTSHPQHT